VVMTFQRFWKKRRAMPLMSEPLTEAVLRIAGPGVASEEDARRALAPLRRGRARRFAVDGPPSFDAGDWELARRWLQEWLPKIRSYGSGSKSAQESVREEINAALFANGSLTVFVGSKGLEYAAEEHMTTLLASALAVLPFVIPQPQGWPPQRLGQCRHRYCGRWFLRPPPRRGSVAEYCSTSHASSERVMRFRDKTPRKPK